MARQEKVKLVTELLHLTDSAYDAYQKKVLNGDPDTHWPEWYAEYLIGHGLDLVMEDRLATEMLVRFLRESRADHRSCDSNLTWEEFTARKMVERLV
jgi:hypothetical protein